MPELPEVESIARRLQASISGRQIRDVRVLWERTIDALTAAEFSQRITGSTIESVGRRGKYLLFALEPPMWWLVHLRMSGKFTVTDTTQGDSPNHKHTRVTFGLEGGLRLDYIDMRKFGRFYMVDDPARITGHLGIEPLSPAFTGAYLQDALQNRRGEIKRLLLDQECIAGIGNIYASEALWLAGIHPTRSGASLDTDEVSRLRDAIVTTLSAAIANGGTSLDDRQYVYPDGSLGGHQAHLHVYDRAGDVCSRCGYPVERMVLGQRSTYYCPVCQSAQDDAGSKLEK